MTHPASASQASENATDRARLFGRLILILLILIAGMSAWTWWWSPRDLAIDADDVALVELGKRVYATNCAACHGAQLEGQPDWRLRRPDGRLPAPPHDASGHTWHHPDDMLIGMVQEGFQTGRYAPPGYASDMPGYGGILGKREIISSLAYIKSTWPKQQRLLQQRVTRQARQNGGPG